LQTLETGKWQPVVSPTLAFEYEEVGLTTSDIEEFIAYLLSRAKLVQIFFRWRPVLPDADDDRILEVAVRSGTPW
jgi:hypothetical protein